MKPENKLETETSASRNCGAKKIYRPCFPVLNTWALKSDFGILLGFLQITFLTGELERTTSTKKDQRKNPSTVILAVSK
jgi:hypothetical protein